MNKFLFIIFFIIYLVFVIPVILIYLEHGKHEIETSQEQTGKKAIRTLAEGLFLFSSGIGYITATILIFLYPKNPIPYLAVIVGTIIIVLIYYMRMEGGVIIPFTDGIIIQKYTVGLEGLVTKVCQQIIMVPISLMLAFRTFNKNASSSR